MDNEKFQDLMLEQFGKVLNKLTAMESDVSGLKLSQMRMEEELAGVKQSQIRMETEFGKKLDILYYDWRETQKKFNEEVKLELKILSTKVEALQMESNKHDREIRELFLIVRGKEKTKQNM